MVLCPIALAVGCKKCPVFAVCPVKSIIGDQPAKSDPAPAAKESTPTKPAARKSAAKSAKSDEPSASRGRARKRATRKNRR